MKQYNVGVIGATGMVGQRFTTLLESHPWFNLVALAASTRSAGKTYEEAVGSRWLMKTPMPESVKKMVVLDAANVEEVAAKVDFVFCAVNMKKDEIKALEEAYAKAECPVVSNNSAHRFTPDVPMVVPEINADHIDIIPAQRKRLGTKRGFVAVKSNCSLQSYVPALHPLRKYGISDVLVCTYQAISGAGKTFETFPDILANVIPSIGGEEDGVIGMGEVADPAECAKIAALGIDFLAAGIGNIHGKYPANWKGLDFEALDRIHKATNNIPLVLHGGTGIPDEMIKKAISLGVSKINVNTECQLSFADATRKYIEAGKDLEGKGFDPRKLLAPGAEAIKATVREKIELFGSANKA